jgi:hypothetical protein
MHTECTTRSAINIYKFTHIYNKFISSLTCSMQNTSTFMVRVFIKIIFNPNVDVL